MRCPPLCGRVKIKEKKEKEKESSNIRRKKDYQVGDR